MNKWWGTVTAVCAAASALPAGALTLSTDQTEYWRYELVTLTAGPGNSPAAVALPDRLLATVVRGGRVVAGPGELERVPLRKQADGTCVGFWPIPFQPEIGTYTATVAWPRDGVTHTAKASFTVRARTPYHLPPGFSVVTDEGGKVGPNGTPGLSPAEPKTWKNLVRWASFMGADALWQCIGQTQVWGRFKPEQFPWFAGHDRLMRQVGREAHEAGLKYGAWITAFVVIGDQPELSGYQFTLGYDRETETLEPLRYVSLGCDKRLADLAALLQVFEDSPDVDFLGLDYMRTDFGGYEFAEDFVRDMSIPTPPEWSDWTTEERRLWMARLIEVARDPVARERWEWWRAHRVALVVESLMAQVKPRKPVWVFSLGWKTGHQHGQDVNMMLDAGIGFNAPMFYSIDKPDFPAMLTDWRSYLRAAPISIAVGECVDWNLLGRTLDPSGPEEHFVRQVQALDRLAPLAESFGLFWHDLARAHFGARGPYGAMEWAMSGAASFSRIKQRAGRIPYEVRVQAPERLEPDAEQQVTVEINTPAGAPAMALDVSLVPLPRLRVPAAATRLPAAEPGTARQVSLSFTAAEAPPANGRRQMLAVRVQDPEHPGDPYFTFLYRPVGPDEVVQPAGTTRAGQTRP